MKYRFHTCTLFGSGFPLGRYVHWALRVRKCGEEARRSIEHDGKYTISDDSQIKYGYFKTKSFCCNWRNQKSLI